MSRRHFSVLLIAALVTAAAVALLVPGRTGQQGAIDNSAYLADIADNVNEIDRVTFTGGGGSPVTTIERGEKQWTILELDGFPADWDRLRTLLTDLAQAEVVEAKTSNPDYYHRLGVEEVSGEEAQGVLIGLAWGEQTAEVIAGNAASDRGGQYLRRMDQQQSVLIDRELEIAAEPVEWAVREVLDISSAQVAEIEISHPDGDRILARKSNADEADFSLVDLPEGREILSSWSVNSLANVFSLLRMEGVRPDPGASEEASVRLRMLTFSGIELNADIFEEDGAAWMRLIVTAPDNGEVAGESVDDAEPEQPEDAGKIIARTSGWLFRLSESKHQAMTKRLDQLLKSVSDDQESSGG